MWRNAISSKDTGMLKRWGIDSNLKPRLEWLEKGDDSITLDQAMQWCNVHPSSRTVARVFNCTWPELHDGSLCYLQPQSVCLNQCSGLGECKRGMCSCYPGWTGIDCSLRIPSVPSSLPQSNILPFKGNLRRPRIFIYELPEVFNSRVLQFRYHGTCTTREFKPGTRGPAKFTNWDYNFDFMILEWLLHSVYRTTDPDEADYFFVPFLSSCYIYFGDSHPRHRLAHGARVTAAAQAAKLIHQHIDSAYPFWRRKGGKDHIWVWPWDEGACAAPAVIRPSIMISHWGARYTEPRTAKWEDNWLRPNVTWDASNFGPFGMAFQDLPATYDTASGSFNDRGMTWAGHREERGEAHCHDPGKDIVVPPPTSEWRTSEGSLYMRLLSKRLRDETFNSAILFYFAGDLGAKAAKASGSTGGRAEPNYSWGLRQRLAQLYANAEWQRKGIHVYHGDRPAYLDEMSRSKFCGVLPGDGWTSTYVVAITHGCIPVLIMDDVDLAWSSIMDYSAISVRIAEADLPRLYYILKAMPAHYVSALQDQVDKVWPRFVYFKYHVAMVERFVSMGLKEEGLKEDTVNLATEPMRDTEIIADDAMDTLLQQLYYRLPDVRRMMDINGKN